MHVNARQKQLRFHHAWQRKDAVVGEQFDDKMLEVFYHSGGEPVTISSVKRLQMREGRQKFSILVLT